MRVLIVGQKNNGVGYHRLYIPYAQIERTTDIEFFGVPEVDTITLKEAETFDAVIFNRNISPRLMNPTKLFAIFKAANCKIIMDIDDYWNLYPGHVLKSYYIASNYIKCSVDQLRYADHITTTNQILKDQIVKLGIDKKKVTICRNGIDPEETQFNQEFRKENKLMWQGSTTHAKDLEFLSEIDEEIQMCGYMYSPEWFDMCSKVQKPVIKDGLPIDQYMNLYHNTSISLIPLKDNLFNRCKSELKMIESGWCGNAVIVSEMHPYTYLAETGINSFTCKTADDFKKYAKILLGNENLQRDLGGQLQKEVKEKYLLPKINEKRLDLLWNLAKN